MTAVFHVLLDTLVINPEPIEQRQSLLGNPWAALRVRVWALRQQARTRLRARTSRMGIDPATEDHVGDAVDQRIETAAARVEQAALQAEAPAEPWTPEAQATVVNKLQQATEEIAQAAKSVDTLRAGTPATEFVVGSRQVRRKDS